MATGSELSYNINANALQMADAIFGPGVTIEDARYFGDRVSSATYSNGQRAAGVVPANNGLILSTGDVRSFTQSNGDPNRSAGTTTNTENGINNDAQFNALAGGATFDAAILEVDFVPAGNTMTMRFVFASEEYPEYINSNFNDVVGVWINGQSVPMVVNGGTASVNNINNATQQNLFVDNTNDAYNTEMDGFTVTLSLTIPVNPGVTNTIRIGIADVGDATYDSNLLIAGDSLQTAIVAADDSFQVDPNEATTINVLGNDSTTVGALTITHVNGQPVVAGQTITLASGEQITLNANGTFTVLTDATVETQSFTYTVSNGQGGSDVGLVTLNIIHCFVAGCRIATPEGLVPVEELEPGDMVLTRDDGAQPLRWIGRRRVDATGDFAPIAFAAGCLGDHGAVKLSPEHRVLVTGARAEILFGEEEVLVAAKHLVNDGTIRRQEGGEVEYLHLMFDRHQVIWAEGLPSESFFPGAVTMAGLEDGVRAELCALFPGMDPKTGAGYGPTARRVLRGFEAEVMMGGRLVNAAA